MQSLPVEDEVLGWLDELSNWGRWGEEDQLGTLNLITSEKVVAAARSVEHGESVSCSWDVKTGPQVGGAPAPLRYTIESGEGCWTATPDGEDQRGPRWAAAEEVLVITHHGASITHIDALCHFFWDGKMYNGGSSQLVTTRHGATRHDIRSLAKGITTRGVLLDLPAALGVDSLPPDRPILPEDLELAEERAGLRVAEGDVLFIRSGEGWRRLMEPATYEPRLPHTGVHAACMPWLHERGVAVLAPDLGQEHSPSGYDSIRYPVHILGIVAMGLWLVDNCQLEDLAEACSRHGRAHFLVHMSPVRFRGATGGPVNPIAVF